MDGRARPLTARMLHTLHRVAALAAACAALCATAASAAGRPDPQLANQWALQGDGPMGAASAWTRITGGDVTVAVVDTGVDLSHRDLAPNLWTNPGEVPGNGIDDDGDGLVDDVHGADFVNGDGTPADDNGHGTHIAGIIAAHGAIRGLAPGATIMPVKVLGAGKAGNAHWLAEGIDYAVAHGARILNVSVNGDGADGELEAAIDRAQAAGAVIVASAGNDGRDLGSTPSFPVSYPQPNVLGVGATGSNGRRAAYSNYGP